MELRRIVMFSLLLVVAGRAGAQNYLVTRQVINQKIQDGTFMQKTGTTITNDNQCMDVTEAKARLYLNEVVLPTNGRMPWYQELDPLKSLPCTSGLTLCAKSNAQYGACGAYIYNQGFNNSLTIFTRTKLTNAMWSSDATACGITVSATGPGGGSLSTAKVAAMSRMTATDSSRIGASDSSVTMANRADTSAMQLKAARVQALAAAAITGPFNGAAVWPCTTTDKKWVYFERTINVPATKTYYMGIAGDNAFRFSINGWKVIQFGDSNSSVEAFKIWHIFPIELGAGIITLRFEGYNTEDVAALGVEFYDNTAAQIQAATSRSNLNIMFTSADLVNKAICQ